MVTISSVMGLLPSAGLSDYCASKFATVGLAKCLRLEMLKLTAGAVGTSLICPYAIKTGMFEGTNFSYQWLFPLLMPQFVASKVVDAVKYKYEMLVLPWTVDVVIRIMPLLPQSLQDYIYSLCGGLHGMDTFKGHAKNSKN